MKYPKESLPKKPTSHIADKKYGFFQSDAETFKDVAEDLGLIKRSAKHLSFERHPLTFLVEAADDICYTIIDFEDGINLGLISEDFALEYLINLVRDSIITENYNKLKTTKDRLSYLRALAINALIQDAAKVFMTNEEAILNGKFSVSLMDKSKFQAQIKDIIKISVEKIYRSKEVIEKEIAGYKAINCLLYTYITAINNNFHSKSTNFDNLVLQAEPVIISEVDSLYERLLHVCNYVALLSDGQTIYKYKTVSGQKI